MYVKTLQKGFTLVELLVSISIVAILIAISIFGIQGAKESARNAKRKADLEAVRSALEIYKADKGEYPLVVNEYLGWEVSYDGDWLDNLPSNYLQNRGVDPINNSPYTYRYAACDASPQTATGMPTYKVQALLESGHVGKRCPQCTGHKGGVGTSPGETDGANEWECITNP